MQNDANEAGGQRPLAQPVISRARALAVLSGLLLPTLVLIPLGSIWLWQQGYLLYWAIAALLCTAAAFIFQWWLLRRVPKELAVDTIDEVEELPDARWSQQEREAWRAVLKLADTAIPEVLVDRDKLIDLGLTTIDVVARRYHPQVGDPLWQFTVPEALVLVQRVSSRLEPWIMHNIPLIDRMTIAQIRYVYRWRNSIDVANRAWEIWRIVRLANPATAATHELREQMSKLLYGWGKDAIGRRLVQAYVRETGRAAIDLYSGRLHPHFEPPPSGDVPAASSPPPGVIRQIRNAAGSIVRRRK